jgi:FdhD protein
MPDNELFKMRKIIQVRDGIVEEIEDAVVQELPLTVFFNHTELANMVCSPGGLRELAAGFLLSEGLLHSREEIREIAFREEEGILWIETSNPQAVGDTFLSRHTAGYYGKHRGGALAIIAARQDKPEPSPVRFQGAHLLNLINRLEDQATLFKRTGGVHNAALADQNGFLCRYDDIGRHNAVDKALGYAFLNGIPTQDKCLLLSGRVASEILLKAAQADIPLILSRAAPTGLTIDLAQELNMTVVGFARGQRYSIYTHPERVII